MSVVSIETTELTELEYLQLFYAYADFGPADGDVRDIINWNIRQTTGKNIPSAYQNEDSE